MEVTGATRFIQNVVAKAEQVASTVDFRLDAGYPSGEIMDALTDAKRKLVGRLRGNPKLDALAAPYVRRPAGRPPREGYEYTVELGQYQVDTWRHAQRLILVVVDRPDPVTGQLGLFPAYFFLITHWPRDKRTAEELLTHYRGRGTFEDRFGEFMRIVTQITRAQSRPYGRPLYSSRRLPTRQEGTAFACGCPSGLIAPGGGFITLGGSCEGDAMKYVFGPVPSRRLGQSLGVDPIPFKTCNWNCIYCQLGRTSPLTNERRDYFPPDEIMAEVTAAVQAHRPGEIDWITFVGSGEPTLHASLGAMLRNLKTLTTLPLAVITNGSLLHLPEVRQELLAADALLPTLDAGTRLLYQKINRPMPELDFDQFVQGLVDFREQYSGKLWLEVMLIAGINDSQEALEDLARVLTRIRPDEVHVNSPVRPPCEPWVRPTDAAGLARATRVLGGVCRVIGPPDGEFDLAGFDNAVDAIVAVITRHPISEEELVRVLDRWDARHVRELLAELARSGRAQVVVRDEKRFWSCAAARYVDEMPSRCHENPGSSGAQS